MTSTMAWQSNALGDSDFDGAADIAKLQSLGLSVFISFISTTLLDASLFEKGCSFLQELLFMMFDHIRSLTSEDFQSVSWLPKNSTLFGLLGCRLRPRAKTF
jgi:hypothetical protein